MQNPTKSPRLWLFATGAALLGIAMLTGLHFLADNYLRSEAFRKALDDRISNSLDANAHVSALSGDCTTLRAAKFEALANGLESPFARLAAEDIRASPSLLQSILHQTLSLDSVEAETLSAELGSPHARTHSRSMEVGSIEIHRLNLGSIFRGMHLTMKRSQTLWTFTGAGGFLERAGFPPIAVEKLEGQLSSDNVLLQEGILHGASGVVFLNGNVQLAGERTAALNGTVKALPMESILPEDWRAQIRGPVSGVFQISGSLNNLETSGHLTMDQGVIEALPMLGSFEQFREVNISNGSADFTATGSDIHIRNLALESPGLCRIEGGLVISPSGALSGELELGIAPAGILRQVFTEAHGGYLWTTVHVSGTTRFPVEDLSPRIAAAAANEMKAKGSTALKGAVNFLGNLINN